jgi:hypothetical protein
LLGVLFVPIFFVWVLSLFARKKQQKVDDTALPAVHGVGE